MFFTVGSALCSKRSLTTSTWPSNVALCSGVQLSLSLAFGSAPFFQHLSHALHIAVESGVVEVRLAHGVSRAGFYIYLALLSLELCSRSEVSLRSRAGAHLTSSQEQGLGYKCRI